MSILLCMYQHLNFSATMTCTRATHHEPDVPANLRCARMATATKILWNWNRNKTRQSALNGILNHKHTTFQSCIDITYLVPSLSGWCCDVEQKNKSNKFTFCISTTHNWFNKMTSRFSTSVGNRTPKLDVKIFSNGRKNDSWTSNNWWRECVTNCSYSFNCSNRTASEYLQNSKKKNSNLYSLWAHWESVLPFGCFAPFVECVE